MVATVTNLLLDLGKALRHDHRAINPQAIHRIVLIVIHHQLVKSCKGWVVLIGLGDDQVVVV